MVEVAVTGVTMAFAIAACSGTEGAGCICVGALAGDGMETWVDTMAMTGAETGARADVGIWTGEGSEAETGICAESWEPGLAETGGRGEDVCIWRWVEVRPEGAQTDWDWNWTWVWKEAGTGGKLVVGVCAGCEPVVMVEIGAWGLPWIRVGVEGRPCL